MKFIHFSLPNFTLAFLLVGLPIIFALREYVPVSKTLFTYAIVGLMLVAFVNYKNIFVLKFNSNKPLIFSLLLSMLFILFLIFYVFSETKMQHFSEAMYIFITLFTLIALSTRKMHEFVLFPYYLMIISSITTVITFLTTPLSFDFWLLNGGRLYVGDTENPNLSSFIALMNVLSIIFYFHFAKIKIKFLTKLILVAIAFASLYIYFLSFSKSSLLGFMMGLLFLIPSTFYKKRKFLKMIGALILLIIIVLISFPDFLEKISKKMMILAQAFDSYFFGEYENLASDSAAIRHENVTQMLYLLPKVDLFHGYGIFTTRADLPPLQVFTDLGILLGFLNLFVMVLIPLYILFKQRSILKTYINDPLYPLYLMSIVTFIFYLPNLFFHGTPYELSIWLPILILYKFAPWHKKVNYVSLQIL